ncbi:MAG: protein kinase [Polyangia bacterium]
MHGDASSTRRIGRYELLDEIGRGGMAVVYRARDTELGREVALKLLHPHLASHEEARNRFRREAQAVARLRHRGVVEIHDFSGERGDEIYIVMELVDGTTLRRVLSQRVDSPLPPEAAALVAREVFDALAAAHDHDVVHRDVKPENILIGRGGRIRLTDFGIAHLAGLDQMTVTGQILGSPGYMSPEHIERAELDARADIFSVGTLLYEMTVGSLPFQGQNPHQIIKRVVEGYYEHPLGVNPAIGHDIAGVIVRCLQNDPQQRYSSAREAVRELDDALEGMGIGEPGEELRSFFEDPDRWEAERRPQIVEATFRLGQIARKARRLPEAMDHFNRVLALDPGNEKALDAVAGLSRRRRLRRVLERVSLFLAVGVAMIGVGWGALSAAGHFTAREDPEPRQDPAAQPDAGRTEADDPGEEREEEGEEEKAGAVVFDASAAADGGASAMPRLLARPIVRRKKETRQVVFVPRPQGVDIVIDGGDEFSYGPGNTRRELEVGSHTIRFVPNEMASARLMEQTWTVEVPPGEGPFKFSRRLKWRPARVTVFSEVDAEVSVIGRGIVKRTNRVFAVPLEDPDEHGAERISLLVRAEGYRPVTKRVTIVAGEAVDVRASLDREGAATGSSP